MSGETRVRCPKCRSERYRSDFTPAYQSDTGRPEPIKVCLGCGQEFDPPESADAS